MSAHIAARHAGLAFKIAAMHVRRARPPPAPSSHPSPLHEGMTRVTCGVPHRTCVDSAVLLQARDQVSRLEAQLGELEAGSQ